MFGKLFSRDTQGASAILNAISKSQAMIEFSLDGTIITANERFLTTMGYSLAEIKGKHHRIFVDPTYGDSDDYKNFWASLRRGDFQAAQFKRLGKSGREVWIEASYNPVLGSDGRPYKVVKYATDVTAQKMEYANFLGQNNAIRKSLAVIEFKMDGTIIDANENFLNALGYHLSEIKGRHHSMFLSQEHARTDDYKKFWENLNRGDHQSGQFRRLGKGGRTIWIEASYNPILDLNGKPFKVVKYATDVTRQMETLANLKILIDRNFGDIERALEISTRQAGDADTAAGQTSATVQMMAAGAEELATSVREISETMSQSRAAADLAADLAVEADSSTQRLVEVARSMEGVVEAIRAIAGQINLLALNATIEAARAGEAGKGFAVVATEVKNLANQSASATQKISDEIDGMQKVSADVVTALNAIRGSIGTVREYVTTTASAVEEQSAVTREMSMSMQKTADAVERVTSNLSGISSAIGDVGRAVATTKDAARVLAQ